MKHLLMTSLIIASFASTTFAQTSSEAPADSTTTEIDTSTDYEDQKVSSDTAVTANATSEFPRSLIGVYGGLGVPHGLSAGLEYLHQSRHWSVATEIGGYSYKPKDEDATKEQEFSIANFEVVGRYHPYQSALYFAAALGAQNMKAEQTVESNGQTIRPEVELKNIYITPKIGWFWQFNSGVNFGFEFGAQIPVAKSETINPGTDNSTILNDPDFIKAQNDVRDLASTIGKHVLPHALIRLGYAF